MKRRLALACLGFGLAGGRLAPSSHAAEPPTAAVVELPPMMVEESISTVPWLYASAGGTEFLSRCSEATTREFAEAWLEKMQLVRALVPEEFLGKTDVPAVFVLYAQDLEQTVSAEIQRELQSGEPRVGNVPGRDRINIAPNMRLSDRDMHASIVYFDEALFNAGAVSVAPAHVRYLLQRRVPELPAWFVEGLERTWRRVDFLIEPITLHPLIWHDPRESDALAADATRPRALLPANELFAAQAARTLENQHRRHVETRNCTQELFVRWALVSGRRTRETLWQLARHAAEAPVTEEMFEASFGFDFAELRDRLSDYLPKAVKETTSLEPGKLAPPPLFEVTRATPDQIARVRGEWERLAIGHVRRRLPQVREPYIAQARRTLHRAYDAGDRDPRLLATMGLCEIDAGNDEAAPPFLEAAVARGVVRPRAYYELARLRFGVLRRMAPDTKSFSFTELAPVIAPLRRGLGQAPPLPEAFTLLAEAWARCATSPNTAEFAELATGARLFASRPDVTYPLALAFAHHGKSKEAAALLETCAAYARDDTTRAKIAALRTELARARTGAPRR